MPEFLNPDELALRDKCHQFAKDHLGQNITGQATATRDEIVRFAKETGIYGTVSYTHLTLPTNREE